MIKCEVCGKFISYKDLDSNLTISKEVWSYDYIPDLDHIAHYCIKCTALERDGKDEG